MSAAVQTAHTGADPAALAARTLALQLVVLVAAVEEAEVSRG